MGHGPVQRGAFPGLALLSHQNDRCSVLTEDSFRRCYGIVRRLSPLLSDIPERLPTSPQDCRAVDTRRAAKFYGRVCLASRCFPIGTTTTKCDCYFLPKIAV
ncbi:uncharacterized protein LOC142986622 isoform X2 [Anticarsia gemmatalis]|uniref:uncharacterized protein LOC142986622 isoform X2 n=1 Tax=Anticarsia gemmatalis TaxID=129554 RepID=UPI003F75EB0F